MAVPRPSNHVTRAMEAARQNARQSPDADWPEVHPRLVAFLEKTFPPRCKTPTESLEAHMHYAGTVHLVGLLRSQVNRIADFSQEDDLDAQAEREVADKL